MAIKKFRPYTPVKRHETIIDRSDLAPNSEAPRSLLTTLKKSYGRNNAGRITTRHKGGRVKVKYRIIDFKREKEGIPAEVVSLHYDPNRSARLALLKYVDGEFRYILSPLGLKQGDKVVSGSEADIKVGNSKKLSDMPVGTIIHNIELSPGAGAQLARSAGTFAQLMAKESDYVLVRLPSGELRRVPPLCRATIGQVGNLDHENVVLGKAGKSRHLGRRPTVRGVSMNPVDHPMGGGEGRTSGGRHPVTPWGMPTRGYKTRSNKRTQKYIVTRRKK